MQHLLLLHGAIGAKDQLQQLADKLNEKNKIHTLNFSGHGGKPFAGEDFSMKLFAGEVLSYLDQNSISNINIFGYSMGGYVAMYLAKYHPSFVGKIITLATKFYWDEAVAAKETKMLDADTILQKIPAFAEQLSVRHDPNDWKIVLGKTREMLIQLGKGNSLQIEDYKTITTNCLLLLGDSDKMATLEETIAVKNALVHGELKILSNTTHPIEQVDTAILASIINEFVN